MRHAALITLAGAVLTLTVGCSKEAAVTIRSGPGADTQPYIKCEAIMENPDFVPSTRDDTAE